MHPRKDVFRIPRPSAGILVGATLLFLTPALPLAAQASGESTGPTPAVSADVKLTSLSHEARVLGGGWVGLSLTPRTMLGGGGFFLGRPVVLPTSGGVDSRSLSFGYGGLRLTHERALGGPWRLGGAILLGSGHAIVRNRSVGFELGADNVGVVEPEVTAAWRGRSALEIAVSAGYRAVFGVEDLPGVDSGELGGPGLTVSVRLRGG